MSDKSQKTEQPTPKRLEKARKDGNFPNARHFVSGVQLVAAVALLGSFAGGWVADIRRSFVFAFRMAFRPDLGTADITALSMTLVRRAFLPLVGGGALLVVLTLGMQLGSTKMGFSLKKLSPDLKRLNPLARVKGLGRQNIPALVQALILIPVCGAALYFVVQDNLGAYLALPLRSAMSGAAEIGLSLKDLLWKAAAVFGIFGCIDLYRQRRRYQKDLRMSKQEIRDEVKEQEGNPQVKAKIRRMRRDMLRRRMMSQVPKATAVIVNPTHYAVALKYDAAKGAPQVLAKGAGVLARRIRTEAETHSVPIVHEPVLTRALYAACDLGALIPVELYEAVAQVLAFVFSLRSRGKAAGYHEMPATAPSF